MKYDILCDFRTSASFKEKFSSHFKDLYKLKLLTNFDVSLTLSPGRVMNSMFTTLFITSPCGEVK